MPKTPDRPDDHVLFRGRMNGDVQAISLVAIR